MSNVELLPGVVRDDLPADAQPQEDIIAYLRKLLEQAENGQIQAIAACFVKPDAATGFGIYYTPGSLPSQLLSASLADLFLEEFTTRSRRQVVLDPAS
jgi:hypothetical protein